MDNIADEHPTHSSEWRCYNPNYKRYFMKVYVKSKQGNWLMPTYPAKARFLLKQGKATVIQRTPFAIQLTEETTEYTQEIIVGIDDGGIHVGVACVANNESIYQEEVQLRTDIKSKMDTRRSYRRGRRHRHCRYRQARFLNRKNSRKSGRIPPSIKAKKDAIVRTITRLPLPTPTLIRLENAYFDFQAMDDPTITGKGYQQGAMLYQKNYKSAAKTRDDFKCRVCGQSEKLQIHHIKPTSKGGTDRLSNLMTLCETHHWQHHNEGLKLPQQKTRFYTFAAHVQQGKYYLQDQLRQIAPVQTTFGYITAHWRKKQNIRKSHCNDAVVIARLNVAPDQHLIKSTCIQLRKRSLHEATARKGRKQPNITQKRNNKNVFQVKTFKKWDCVSLSGKIGFISGFTGTSAYIVDIDGSYIRQPKKSYKQVTLSKLKKLHANQDRISQLCLA
jgi:hypothetical protein